MQRLQAQDFSVALSPQGVVIGFHVLNTHGDLVWVALEDAEPIWLSGVGTKAPFDADPRG